MAKGKRKADDEDGSEGEDVDYAEEKPKKPRAKKAKDADGEKVAPKPKKVSGKPLSAEEQAWAAQASMERNKAVVAMLQGVANAYKETQEWIKMAAANKAWKAVDALTVPFVTVRELGALQGIGKGTVAKIEEFLRTWSPGAAGAGGAGGGGALGGSDDSGRDPEFSWLESSERDVVVGMLKDGSLALDKVKPWRNDITQADIDA